MVVSQLQSMFTFPEDLFTEGFDRGKCWTQSLVWNVLNTIWKIYYFPHEPCWESVYRWTFNSRFRWRLKMSSICTHGNGNVCACTIHCGASFISCLYIVILPKHQYDIHTFFIVLPLLRYVQGCVGQPWKQFDQLEGLLQCFSSLF